MMKNIRRISTNPLVVILIIVSFLFASCTPNSVFVDETSNFSAESLFKGIIFFDGEVASRVPYIEQNLTNKLALSEEEMESYRKFQDEVITFIKTNNPSFLPKFKKEIESKDVYRINDIIKEATKYNLEFLKTFLKDNRIDQKLAALDFTTLKEDMNKEEVDVFKQQIKSQLNYNAKDDTCFVCLVLVVVVIAYVAVYYYYQVIKEVEYEVYGDNNQSKSNNDVVSFTNQELLISISDNL